LSKTNFVILGVASAMFIVAVLFVMAGGPRIIMGNMMSSGADTESLDTAETRLSEQGFFKAAYVSSSVPVPVNQIHTWRVQVETADGLPLDQAEITVNGGMPQHGHGLPTRPQVTQYLGEGEYLVEGMKFNMPGWWEVKFDISANGQSDTVTFNLVLK
jgi:hypothetical protein